MAQTFDEWWQKESVGRRDDEIVEAWVRRGWVAGQAARDAELAEAYSQLAMAQGPVISVQPEWVLALPIQQQSVLFLAGRGPDGVAKFHPCKRVQRAYRGTVLIAAKYGRPLKWGERADSFMGLDEFANPEIWPNVIEDFFEHVDELPHHFLLHLLHGAEILSYKHPDERFRSRWASFYLRGVEDMHLFPESEEDMDARLSDWGRRFWK